MLAPSLTWRPTNNTNWTVLGTYQKDKTGSSTAFLPHEGTLYPGPNGLIPVRRFAGEPGFDKYQTETGAISSLFEHSFSDGAEDPAEHALRPCRGHLPDDISESEFVDPSIANPNFPFLDAEQAHRGARHMEPRDSQGQLHLGQQCRAEIAHRAGCAQGCCSAPTTAGSGNARNPASTTDTTPFDLYAPVYSGVTAPALSPNRICGRASSGFMRRTRCGSGHGWPSLGLRQDYVTSNVAGIAGRKHQGDHRPRRADVRTAVRPDALCHLCAVVHAGLRRRRLRRRHLQGRSGRNGGARLQVQSDARHRDQRRDLRHHRKEPAGEPIPTARRSRSRPARCEFAAPSSR